MRRKITGVILLSLVCLNTFIPQQQAHAEVCPTYNFQSIFFEEFYGTRWDNRAGNIEITWSLNRTVIRDENIVRNFSGKEQVWVREAFTSWDDALSTVSFKEAANPDTAQISIGLVPLNQPGAAGFWNATWFGNWRNVATIKIKESIIASNELSIKSKTPFVDSDTFQRNWLIGIVQHELGNVLGLGDIKPDSGVVSIQNDPFSSNATFNPLRESDVAMMRQLYGESTCPSTFTPAYKAAVELKGKQEAEAKAGTELKAKQEAEAKAAAELIAKQEAELKAAAELKAKQEAEAKAAAELIAKQEAELKAAAELKAKQEAEAKAAAELIAKQEAEAKAAAELKAKQDAEVAAVKAAAELKAKQEAEAKAAAELKAKQEADAKAAATKKTTITCVKGKLTKKVTAVKPVCPRGYKVKR